MRRGTIVMKSSMSRGYILSSEENYNDEKKKISVPFCTLYLVAYDVV